MRPEYPSGLVLGPGIGRSPVRFPARARSVLGHLFINVGTCVHQFWDVLGCVWEWFGNAFGSVWDGFENNVGRGQQKHGREYFSRVGLFYNNMFSLSPVKKIEMLKTAVLLYSSPPVGVRRAGLPLRLAGNTTSGLSIYRNIR